MDDYYQRSRFKDLIADMLVRIRERHPDFSDADATSLEVDLRSAWGGLTVTIARRLIPDRERIRELIAAGLSAREARRRVRGK